MMYKGLTILSQWGRIVKSFSSFRVTGWLRYYSQLLTIIKSSFCFLSFTGMISRMFPNIFNAKLGKYMSRWHSWYPGGQGTATNEMAFLSWVTCCQVSKEDLISGGQQIIDSLYRTWWSMCLNCQQWWIGFGILMEKNFTNLWNLSGMWEIWNSNYTWNSVVKLSSEKEGSKKLKTIRSHLKTRAKARGFCWWYTKNISSPPKAGQRKLWPNSGLNLQDNRCPKNLNLLPTLMSVRHCISCIGKQLKSFAQIFLSSKSVAFY